MESLEKRRRFREYGLSRAGLSEQEIDALCGFEFVTPADKKTVFESTTATK
jgi:hypothetical protein